MTMQESGEMYLETILVLANKLGTVHSIDVAHEMNFSKAAISRAMTRLKADGYVIIDEDSHINLTEKGRKIAEDIYERHNVLASFLMSLGVPEEIAVADACKMEHDISEETFGIIKNKIK